MLVFTLAYLGCHFVLIHYVTNNRRGRMSNTSALKYRHVETGKGQLEA